MFIPFAGHKDTTPQKGKLFFWSILRHNITTLYYNMTLQLLASFIRWYFSSLRLLVSHICFNNFRLWFVSIPCNANNNSVLFPICLQFKCFDAPVSHCLDWRTRYYCKVHVIGGARSGWIIFFIVLLLSLDKPRIAYKMDNLTFLTCK